MRNASSRGAQLRHLGSERCRDPYRAQALLHRPEVTNLAKKRRSWTGPPKRSKQLGTGGKDMRTLRNAMTAIIATIPLVYSGAVVGEINVGFQTSLSGPTSSLGV